jgi:hypothetical protein
MYRSFKNAKVRRTLKQFGVSQIKIVNDIILFEAYINVFLIVARNT